MAHNPENAIKITVDGSTVTSGAASASIALPVNAAGTAARIIRVLCPVEASYAFVKVGNSTVTATTNSIAVNMEEPVYLDTTGCTHIAYIQGSAAAIINIVPIEW